MKKLSLLITLIFGMLILSCSSDENDNPSNLSKPELLIKNSPWTFNQYELLNVIDAGTSTMTQQEIENDYNMKYSGFMYTFNENGVGYVSSQWGTFNWQWEIINSNQLRINWEMGDVDILDNLNVTESQFDYEAVSITFDDSANSQIKHFGKTIFK